jgi:hypothetical protein
VLNQKRPAWAERILRKRNRLPDGTLSIPAHPIAPPRFATPSVVIPQDDRRPVKPPRVVRPKVVTAKIAKLPKVVREPQKVGYPKGNPWPEKRRAAADAGRVGGWPKGVPRGYRPWSEKRRAAGVSITNKAVATLAARVKADPEKYHKAWSEGAQKAQHERWHVRLNRYTPHCLHCLATEGTR